jgi:hypothetical protein
MVQKPTEISWNQCNGFLEDLSANIPESALKGRTNEDLEYKELKSKPRKTRLNNILEGVKRKPQNWNDCGVTMTVSTLPVIEISEGCL